MAPLTTLTPAEQAFAHETSGLRNLARQAYGEDGGAIHLAAFRASIARVLLQVCTAKRLADEDNRRWLRRIEATQARLLDPEEAGKITFDELDSIHDLAAQRTDNLVWASSLGHLYEDLKEMETAVCNGTYPLRIAH